MNPRGAQGRPEPAHGPSFARAPLAWLRQTGALRNARLGLATHRLTAPLAFRPDRDEKHAPLPDRG